MTFTISTQAMEQTTIEDKEGDNRVIVNDREIKPS